ncbi:MAG TPA: T9SS type A sorting domain-containing protein, partial [Candidatus Syntrophosphaera thermopropionivorans]|nr:T9SS type A sorting domain-containing protein [Candidatus Syntrophosphaera thermopropionivorans]
STDSWDLYSEYKAEFTQPKEQKFWNIRLEAVSLEPITFNFEVQGTTPSWQIMMMLDNVSHIVGTSDNFIWIPPAPGIYEGYIRVSNYQVGIDDFVQSPIKGLKIYPNPFNPEVNISFSTATNNNVKINIYNIRGQKITTLYDGKLSAGQHTFHWNGKDSNGRSAASGIYLLRVETGNEHHTLKMILMK